MRQVGEVLLQGAFELAMEASGLGQDLGFHLNGLGHGLGFFLGGLLAAVDGGGVTADVSGDLVAVVFFDHSLLNALRQLILGEGSEGTREGGFAGNLGERFPAAEAA